MVRRGDIWLAALDPTLGSEIRKTRPCLVVSPDAIHDHLRTVIVAPMTFKGRPAPYRVPIHFDGKDGLEYRTEYRIRPDTLAFCFASAFSENRMPLFGPML